MSTKTADEPECESVIKAKLGESFVSLESMIKPSDEFLQIFESSYILFKNGSQFRKKQIRTMKTTMDQLYRKVTSFGNATLNDIVTLACSYQILFHIYVQLDQKRRLHIAEDCVLRCLHLIKGKELHPKTILLALKSHLNLDYIYRKQKKLQQAVQIQEKAVELYLTYTQENEKYGCPIDLEDVIIKLTVMQNGYEKLKIFYIFILNSLIDLHKKIKPINNQSLMTCKHLLLVAEFSKLSETKQYFNWISEAMTLGDYLIKCERFAEARSHFITAMSVYEKAYADKVFNYANKEEYSLNVFNSQNRSMIIMFSVNWVRYGLGFLRYSAKRLLRLEKDEDFAISISKSKYSTKLEELTSQRLLLFSESDKYRNIGSITVYMDAYELFIHTLYYLFIRFSFDSDKDIDSHMQLALDFSMLYKCLALYEKNTVSRISLQNRHVDLLSRTIKDKKCSTCPKIMLRRLQFQLATGYSTLIEAKLESLDAIHPSISSQEHDAILVEIENLLANALTNLKLYTRLL